MLLPYNGDEINRTCEMLTYSNNKLYWTMSAGGPWCFELIDAKYELKKLYPPQSVNVDLTHECFSVSTTHYIWSCPFAFDWIYETDFS